MMCPCSSLPWPASLRKEQCLLNQCRGVGQGQLPPNHLCDDKLPVALTLGGSSSNSEAPGEVPCTGRRLCPCSLTGEMLSVLKKTCSLLLTPAGHVSNPPRKCKCRHMCSWGKPKRHQGTLPAHLDRASDPAHPVWPTSNFYCTSTSDLGIWGPRPQPRSQEYWPRILQD